MDAISLGTLVGLISQAAAGEAGKAAWEGLTTLARRVFDHDRGADVALRKAGDADQDGVLDLAGRLVQSAAADPQLARLLRAWMSETQLAVAGAPVTNSVSGRARIHGDFVQARDIGTVSFGREPGGPGR